MRGSPRARFLLALAALLLAGSCGARTELLAGASSGACAAKGAACDVATPCCAATCSAGTCLLRLALVGDPGAHAETLLDGLLAESATVTRLQSSNDAVSPLDASLLAQFDVVVLEQLTRSYDPGEASALFDWVRAGGGLFSLTGYRNNVIDGQRPNALLAPFGIQYTDVASACEQEPIPDTGSPVTAGVSQLIFCNGYHVDDAGQVGGTDLTLASSSGAPVLISQQRDLGRVLVWGDDWIEFDDQLDADDKLFWQQAIRWLGGA
jgi:hypothetical protein